MSNLRVLSRTALLTLLLLGVGCSRGDSQSVPTPTSSREYKEAELTEVEGVADYRLKASLDTEARRIDASGTIIWRNPSPAPADKLYFHLYLNAFENDETLFLRGAGSRSGKRRGAPGRVVGRKLRSPQFPGVDLWPGPEAHTPDDPKDRTDIAVPLPSPVEGHAELTLEIEFSSHLPQIVERTGYEREFFLVAQWFPKLAKREPDGTWAFINIIPKLFNERLPHAVTSSESSASSGNTHRRGKMNVESVDPRMLRVRLLPVNFTTVRHAHTIHVLPRGKCLDVGANDLNVRRHYYTVIGPQFQTL
jgi:hypothetical protein